jgi:cellulose synthase/poly-beta-1,6-N-acetylglucosamine synthase-like glycosyltransferase
MSISDVIIGTVLFGLLLVAASYYFLLAASAITLPVSSISSAAKTDPRFAVVVPAFNEELVIGKSVTVMRQMNYDPSLFDVIVVADHCQDDTVAEARAAGAICYSRDTGPVGRKGFALAWFIENVLSENQSYRAVIIFDADSHPSKEFLNIMSKRIRDGQVVLQGRHLISNPKDSIFTRIAEIDMRLNNRLRNLARKNLRLSCQLMGDAMCFERAIFESYPWNAFSLVEDKEFGIHLIKHGVHIDYVPEAISRGQAAAGWSQAKSQRMRWSGGMINLRKQYTFDLLRSGFRAKDLSAIDRAIELMLPPYSVLLILSAGLLGLQGIIPQLRFMNSLVFAFSVFLAWLFIPVVGLILDRAPANVFPYLLFGPMITLWRTWIL